MQLTFPDDRVKKSHPPDGGDTGSGSGLGSGAGSNNVDPTPQSTNEHVESDAPTTSSTTVGNDPSIETITEPITSTDTGGSLAVGTSEALKTNEVDDDRQARVRAKRARYRARAKARKASESEDTANGGGEIVGGAGVDAIDRSPVEGTKKKKKRAKRRKASSGTVGIEGINVEELAINDGTTDGLYFASFIHLQYHLPLLHFPRSTPG